MTAQTRLLEPFPAFTESAPVLSDHTLLRLRMDDRLLGSSVRGFKNYLQLRYYQYEVTFGLYMMTPCEKLATNAVFVVTLILLAYGLYTGLQPFVLNAVNRTVYYLTGTDAGIAESQSPSRLLNMTMTAIRADLER